MKRKSKMKKTDKKISKKDIRKSIIAEITNTLTSDILGIAESFDLDSKKSKKLIVKSSKKLAKQLAKHIKIQKSSSATSVEIDSDAPDSSKSEDVMVLPEVLPNE